MIDPLLRGTNRPLISVKWMDPISKYPKRNKWGTQPVALQQPAPLRPIWNTAAPTADQPNSPETRRARVLVGWSNKLLLPHNHKGRIAVASPAGRTSPFQIPRIRMAWIGRRRRVREEGRAARRQYGPLSSSSIQYHHQLLWQSFGRVELPLQLPRPS